MRERKRKSKSERSQKDLKIWQRTFSMTIPMPSFLERARERESPGTTSPRVCVRRNPSAVVEHGNGNA